MLTSVLCPCVLSSCTPGSVGNHFRSEGHGDGPAITSTCQIARAADAGLDLLANTAFIRADVQNGVTIGVDTRPLARCAWKFAVVHCNACGGIRPQKNQQQERYCKHHCVVHASVCEKHGGPEGPGGPLSFDDGVHARMGRSYDGFYPRALRVKHVILHTEHG